MAHPSAQIVHSVYFYDAEEALIQRLMGIVTSVLNSGNGALMILTPEHTDQLTRRLSPRLFHDIHALTRLTILDADATLEKFMVGDMPDRDGFHSTIKKLIDNTRLPPDRTDGKLTLFGEMVAVLWGRGQRQAALALERLWNEALTSGGFYLHCAYPKSQFMYAPDQSSITAICELHSHAFGAFEDAL